MHVTIDLQLAKKQTVSILNIRCIIFFIYVLCLFMLLDKLGNRFPLPLVAPPIGDISLTHVIKLTAHSTMSPTPTAMGQ
jgi:hypothetical protein